MGAFLRFFRAHPWQRRLLTLAMTIVIGLGAALLAHPTVSRWLVLRDLGSSDAQRRLVASYRASEMAKSSPGFLARLNAAMEAARGDDEFVAAATALDRIGKFHTPQRRPVDIDHMHAHEMATVLETLEPPRGVFRRQDILCEAVFHRRDNVYVRRICASAAADERPVMRQRAAVLAAQVGDEAILAKLMTDPDGKVASAAALSAGLARRVGLYDEIVKLLSAADVEVASSAAYAAAMLKPAESSARICQLLKGAADPLRDRLLYVLSVIDDDRARQAVLDVLAAGRAVGQFPPAMAVLAAGRMTLTEPQKQQVSDDLRQILQGSRKGPFRADGVLAALDAAGRMDADVLAELVQLTGAVAKPYQVEPIWGPLARRMGAQAGRRGQYDLLRKRAVTLLEGLAGYYDMEVTRPPDVFTMPTASACAAAALWKLQAPSAEAALRRVAGGGGRLAMDTLAWHAGRGGGQRTVDLGLRMLPALDGPDKVWNDDERGTGAMLMALAAETDPQRSAAADRIAQRLSREDNAYVAETYRCSLVMLGRREMLEQVRTLFRRVPQRRALTALLAADDDWALRRFLWGPSEEEEIDYLLSEEGCGDVLAAVAPSLGGLDAWAPPDLRRWQVRILRCRYGLMPPALGAGGGK